MTSLRPGATPQQVMAAVGVAMHSSRRSPEECATRFLPELRTAPA